MMLMEVYSCFYFWSLLLMILSMALLPLGVSLIFNEKVYLVSWNFLSIHNSSLDFPLIFDGSGVMTSITVLFISSNVLRFAMTYMYYEKFLVRFNYLVLLFVLSMNLLIFIPNLIFLLIGWDGLGLISFLLVIFYQNSKSLSAGMITALTNRIGDGFLLLSIVWSLNSNNWCLISMWESSYSYLIIIMVILASMTKSAQVPFSSWLPAAMAAPTPVSALVHSSTLVTAGVFLLVRFFNFASTIKMFEVFLLIISCLTMLMAALCAVVECDLKKIIALSTLSQLGVMMMSLSIGLPMLALFHLITHALFKALLFICAGSFIFLHSHSQDLRLVGNLGLQLPLTSVCFSIGSFSLCGLPFLSGFYSKDLVLEMMLSSNFNFVTLIMVMLSTGGTAFYSMRLGVYSVLGGKFNPSYMNLSNEDKGIIFPALMLTFGAIFGGSLMNWLMGPFSCEIFLPKSLKMLPLMVVLIGGVSSFFVNNLISFNASGFFKMPLMNDSLSSMWFLTPISSQFMLGSFKPAYYYLMVIDHGWIESVSAQGVWVSMSDLSKIVQLFQSKMINIMMSLSFFFFFFFFIY